MIDKAKLFLFSSFGTLYPYHGHNYHTVPSTGILKNPDESSNAAAEIFCKSTAAVENFVAMVYTYLKRHFAYFCLTLISQKGLYRMKYLRIKLVFRCILGSYFQIQSLKRRCDVKTVGR